MKRILSIAIALCMMAVALQAQTLEQKRICAAKWALQQAAYGTPSASTIAHIDVTKYSSAEQLISEYQSKLTGADQANVKRALREVREAKTEADLEKATRNASAEYKRDIKKLVPAAEEPKPEDAQKKEEDKKPEQPAVDNQQETDQQQSSVEEEVTEDEQDAEEQQPASANGERAQLVSRPAPSEAMFMGFNHEQLLTLVVFLIAVLILAIVVAVLIARKVCIMSEADAYVHNSGYRSDRHLLVKKVNSLELELSEIRIQLKKLTQPAELVATETEEEDEDMRQHMTEESPVEVAEETADDDDEDVSSIEEEAEDEAEEAPASQPQDDIQVYYFSGVTSDGRFKGMTQQREISESIYALKTHDGMTGEFVLINDASASPIALRSVSRLIEPACSIPNLPTISHPTGYKTNEIGNAIYSGGEWRVTGKAVITLV